MLTVHYEQNNLQLLNELNCEECICATIRMKTQGIKMIKAITIRTNSNSITNTIREACDLER